MSVLKRTQLLFAFQASTDPPGRRRGLRMPISILDTF